MVGLGGEMTAAFTDDENYGKRNDGKRQQNCGNDEHRLQCFEVVGRFVGAVFQKAKFR